MFEVTMNLPWYNLRKNTAAHITFSHDRE